jgi:large subunit ribosomal protein L30
VAKKLKITLVRSIIGLSPTQEATVKALGLKRIRHEVEHDDTPTIRGMIATVPFAVEVSEGRGAAAAGRGEPKASRADVGIGTSGSKRKAERSEAS